MTRKIRVLHIIGTFLHGGTEQLMLDILSRLSQDSFDITACSIAGQQEFSTIRKYKEAGIKTKTFSQQPGIRLILALRKYIKESSFDIVHTHHYQQNMYGRIAAILANSPVIFTYKHGWPGQEKNHHRFLFRLLNRWTVRNITVSETIRSYYIDVMGVSPDKVLTIRNGVNLDIFRPVVENESQQIRKCLGFVTGKMLIGFVGRLVKQKRPELFIKAAALVIKRNEKVHFIIAGDGKEKSNLEELSCNLGLGNNLDFLGWHSDITDIYRGLDGLVVTSESGVEGYSGEGFGLTSIEAMASGLSLVAVDTPVNREVIGDGAALFCQPNAKDIADKICRLEEEPALRKELGQAGRRKAEKEYNIKRTVENLSRIYKEVIDLE